MRSVGAKISRHEPGKLVVKFLRVALLRSKVKGLNWTEFRKDELGSVENLAIEVD